jgi:hypothetical protein
MPQFIPPPKSSGLLPADQKLSQPNSPNGIRANGVPRNYGIAVVVNPLVSIGLAKLSSHAKISCGFGFVLKANGKCE